MLELGVAMGTAVGVPAGWDAAAGIDLRQALGTGLEVVPYADEGAAGSSWAPPEVSALIPGRSPVDEAVFDRLPLLRVVSVPGTGVWDSVDVAAASRHAVAVCNVRDYGTDAVAECTIGLMLALVRHLPQAGAAVRDGRWTPHDFVGTELRGQTLGIVGLGAIGARVAELAAAFGMRVLCVTRRPEPDRAAEHGATPVDFDTLLCESDVVSLHARLTDRTRGLLGRDQFERMRPGALLVNTARGGLVDQDALADALVTGRLGGAALDVTDPEPLPDGHLLARLDNVIVTPHIGAVTKGALTRSVLGCLDNVRRFFDGRPTNVVNPDVLR